MKKHVFPLTLILALLIAMLSGCNLIKGEGDGKEDSKGSSSTVDSFVTSIVSVKLNDITLALDDTVKLAESVTIGGEEKAITYTFPGSYISIEDCVLKALVANTETTVTATAEKFVGTFKVTVNEKEETEEEPGNKESGDEEPGDEVTAPEINIVFSDISLDLGKEIALVKSIKVDGEERAVSYTFSGSDISIENYILKALKFGATCAVTVTADGFEASFNVTVGGDKGTMTVEAPEKIYTNYAPKPITVTFSNPAFASEVTYTASDSRVAFKDGGIYATGAFSSATDVTVTAKSEYHTQTFTVNVSAFNQNNAETKVQYYENNIIKAENKGGTIFIGDSYFDGYKKESPPFWSDFYTDYTDGKTFLMGISSSQIDTWEIVSERIVYPMEPKEIVFHIGFNDTYHSSNSAYEIASRIIALLEEFCEKLPNTKIYYCSVEPKKNALTNTQYYESSMIKAPLINAIMEAYAYENKNVKFVNTRQLCFNSDGSINQSFYIGDLSHPSLNSYDSYRQLIEQARGELAASEVIEAVRANQSAVNNAAAEAKLSGTVYNINNSQKEQSAQTIAQYFTNNSGSALTNFYSIKGYMEISNLTSNAHVQFRFGSRDNRFLIYDSNGNKKLGFCAPFAGKSNEASIGSIADALDASGGSVVLSWQVIVTEKTAYFFVNDVLVLYGNPAELNSFNISVEAANISFFGVELVVKSENEAEYSAILSGKKIL